MIVYSMTRAGMYTFNKYITSISLICSVSSVITESSSDVSPLGIKYWVSGSKLGSTWNGSNAVVMFSHLVVTEDCRSS